MDMNSLLYMINLAFLKLKEFISSHDSYFEVYVYLQFDLGQGSNSRRTEKQY